MATYLTPGIYVEETPKLPPSVAEVETALPAFIGYTQKADKLAANDLHLKPTLIRSLPEFEQYFGGPDLLPIAASVSATGSATVTAPALEHTLAYNMQMFFANGGGKCYVVSVGTYAANVAFADLRAGLAVIEQEDEPSLIVIPEAVLLNAADYTELVGAVLAQCGSRKDRFAIFDVRQGNEPLDMTKLIANRASFGTSHLQYGAAYYPFLRTTLTHGVNPVDDSNVQVTIGKARPVALGALATGNTAAYNAVKLALKENRVVLPPSAAIAGVYAATDKSRGVWKAPANVKLASVIEPVVQIDNKMQDNFNVDATSGKSINVLRAFAGKGTLVSGARTLAGNDNEWRYISVRRFFTMVEESVKKSTDWVVFEPNEARTWTKVRGMIENYLVQKWRNGALLGATANEACYVKCGLGTTMTALDVQQGRLIVEIGMAVVRPAEFIVLRIAHKLHAT